SPTITPARIGPNTWPTRPMPMAQPMPVDLTEVGYMPAATAISPVPVPPTKNPARNDAMQRRAMEEVAWPNQARDSPPSMGQGMRRGRGAAGCTAQPDVALAMTLPRLLKPIIRAAADSEKPAELSTAGVQNVTVTSTMKIVKNGTQRRSVGTARPSMNRCL